jgi:sugar/nucleoside kinase (ribokinase family)
MPSVVCVGLVTLDLHQVVDRVPGPNEKTVAESASLEFGGPAANAAATAALLGADATLVTSCGDGPVARLVAEGLADVGVGIVDLAAAPGSDPAVSSVLVDRRTGDRAVVSTNAAGREIDAGRAAAAVAGAGCLLVDGHHLPAAIAAAEAARAQEVVVVLDGGSWKAGTDALLPLVDVALLSADFHRPDGRDAARAALDAGCSVVAISHGPGPLALHTAVGRAEIGVPWVRVVDTLGAGDVLHGAAAYALASGADPVGDATRILGLAVALASLSCEHRGARGWARDERARHRATAMAAAMAGEV